MMRNRQIFSALVFGFVLAITGCGDSGGSQNDGNGGVDADAVCSGGLCDSITDVKQDCIEELNDCLENEPELNEDECIGLARLFCDLEI